MGSGECREMEQNIRKVYVISTILCYSAFKVPCAPMYVNALIRARGRSHL